MPRDEPAWWYAPHDDPRTRLLVPISRLYGWIAERRYARTKPYRSRLCVVCIGNFTAGGTGKTPLGLMIAAACRARGHQPVFLTRGYGGTAKGPMLVDAARTTAAEAGDEPLLLARTAPTVVARDRAEGARFIEMHVTEATLIIMDDGLQNGALAKDLTIAVIDGARGIGNGEIIPAGPLRAAIPFQLDLVDAIVVNAPDTAAATGVTSVIDQLRSQFQGPVLAASIAPAGDAEWLRGRAAVAFAGIGNPERFFATIRSLGAQVADAIAYPDHHVFLEADALHLMRRAKDLDAMLVTTEKDMARLTGSTGAACRALAEAARALPVRMSFGERDLLRLDALIEGAMRS